MALNDRFQKILSLSVASMALLQSANIARSQPSQNISGTSGITPKDELSTKTDSLILEPPHQKELFQLYADHTSHASHVSHYSGTTDAGGYDDSTTVAPSQPVSPTPPPAPPPAPAYVPPPPTFVPENTNAPSVSTNAVATTNSVADANSVANSVDIQLLTKAAAQGSADAQLALGIDYKNGANGLPKNAERAKMLLELSAIQGNSYAQLLLDEFKKDEAQTNSIATP
jgi:hypothetical protein